MTTNIIDYIDVRQRISELGCNIPKNLAIIPINFENSKDKSELKQASEAATVKSIFRSSQIPLDDLLTHPEKMHYIQNNNFDFVVPTLFFASSLIIANQEVVSVALNVLSNYITDFLKGLPGKKNTKIDIIVEQRGSTSYKKISYEGDVTGLLSLAEIVRQVHDE